MTWDRTVGAYATMLVVGYEFQDGAERKLAQSKIVKFFAEGSIKILGSLFIEAAEAGVDFHEERCVGMQSGVD